MALPTIYDLSTPTSNLATLMGLDGSFMPAILSENRIMTGADLVPALFAGAHGYRRSRSILQTLLWGLAGYMAPLPVVAVAAFEDASGYKLSGGAFGDINKYGYGPESTLYKLYGSTGAANVKPRCIKYVWLKPLNGRGKRKRVCKKYAS